MPNNKQRRAAAYSAAYNAFCWLMEIKEDLRQKERALNNAADSCRNDSAISALIEELEKTGQQVTKQAEALSAWLDDLEELNLQGF